MAALVRLIFRAVCLAVALYGVLGLFAPQPAHALVGKITQYNCGRTLPDGRSFSGSGGDLASACAAGGSNGVIEDGTCDNGSPPGGDTGQILGDGVCHHMSSYCSGAGSGLVSQSILGCSSQVVCPGNSIDVGGGSCRCLDGWQEKNGGCEKIAAHSCPKFGDYVPADGGDNSQRYVYPGVDHAGNYCHNGCGEMPEAVGATPDGVGQYSYGGGYATGTACGPNSGADGTTHGSPEIPNSAPQDGAPAACKAPTACSGTVGSTTVCVPCGVPTKGSGSQTTSTGADGSPTGSSTTQTTTKTNSDGSTTTTTTTTNSDGTTTRTITVNPPGSGAGGGTGTGSGGSSGGGGTGTGGGTCTGTDCGSGSDSFGGSCSATFHCDGDAVQCSIALEQHQRDCMMFEPAGAGGDWAHGASTLAQARADGDRPGWSPAASGNEVSTTLDWSTSIDHSSEFAATCPADVAIGSTGMVLSLSSFCPYLGTLGTFMEAMTLIACMFIVFGTKGGSK